MATNIVRSAFPDFAGILATPQESLFAAPIQAARARAETPMQAITGEIQGAGAQLQQSVGGLFGQVPAAVAQQNKVAAIVQQVQSEGVDVSTPEGQIRLAQEFSKYPEFIGMATALRQQAAESALKAEQIAATSAFKRAQAEQMLAKAEAPVKEDISPEMRRYRELIAMGEPPSRARAIAYKTESTDIRREMQAQKEVDKAEKQIASERLATTNAQRVLQTVSEAKQLVGPWTTGFAGGLAVLPGSEARKLQNKIKTIKANLGFDRLQQMRDASPTGGALGQVAVQEIEFLQSTVATLDQLESAADITDALNKIEQSYNNWLGAVQGRAPATTQQPAAQPATPAAAPQQPAQGQFRIKSVR